MILTEADRDELVKAATTMVGPARAEDLVHEAVVRALVARTEPRQQHAYLRRALRTVRVDLYRREQRRPATYSLEACTLPWI